MTMRGRLRGCVRAKASRSIAVNVLGRGINIFLRHSLFEVCYRRRGGLLFQRVRREPRPRHLSPLVTGVNAAEG